MDNLGYVSEDSRTKYRVSSKGPYDVSTITDSIPKNYVPSTEALAMQQAKLSDKGEAQPVAGKNVSLEKRVGLMSGIALIVGTMIGSGIFVSPTGVLERSGSVASSLIIWGACGILSLMGALSYAELGTLIPESGGEYIYFMEGINPNRKTEKSWWKPIPAFLFSWISVFLLKPSSLAIICLTCAEYLTRVFAAGCQDWVTYRPPELSVKLFACVVILMVTFINCYSVKLATKVQNVFTVAKLIAIALIIIGGFVRIGQGYTDELSKGFEGSTSDFSSIATAFYSGLWAYDGWNNLNYVTEELKNPFKDLPRAIIIGIPLVTVCYVLVNVAYLTTMSTSEMLASPTVAVVFGNALAGSAGEVIMIISVVLSTFGGANGSCFTSGRLCYVAAREGHMVDVLSFVHMKRLTPTMALSFNALLALVMIIPSDIGTLIDFFSFAAWIFYGGCMLLVIVLRFTRKDAHRPITVPLIIPAFVLIVSVYLILAPIIGDPQIQYLYAFITIIAGLILYFPFVYYEKSLPGIRALTVLLQEVLVVVPEDY